ncbi:hypothetical protein V8C37DRAFT_387660 [Trichoderma ceciliae]
MNLQVHTHSWRGERYGRKEEGGKRNDEKHEAKRRTRHLQDSNLRIAGHRLNHSAKVSSVYGWPRRVNQCYTEYGVA